MDRRGFLKLMGAGAIIAATGNKLADTPSLPIAKEPSESSSSSSRSRSCKRYKAGERMYLGDLVVFKQGKVYRLKNFHDGNAIGWCDGMSADGKMAYVVSDWSHKG